MKNKGLIIGIIIAISVLFIVAAILAVVLGIKVVNKLSDSKNIEDITNIINKDEEAEEDDRIVENEKTEKNENPANVLNDNDSYFILVNGKKFYAGDEISDLEKVGYSISSNEIDQNVPANKYLIGAGQIVTSENKRSFYVTPYNPTTSSVKVPKAAIGGISINEFETKYDSNLAKIEVYGGIKLGSSIDEVKKIFGEPSWSSEGKTTSTSTITYRYDSEETYRSYTFRFNKDGKVSDISWKNLVFNQ